MNDEAARQGRPDTVLYRLPEDSTWPGVKTAGGRGRVSAQHAQFFLDCIDALAKDVGRLRRRLQGDELALHLVCRVADRIQSIDSFVQPTAAEIYRANLWETGDENESVTAALEDVDRRAQHLRTLLNEEER